ncbi:MAG: M23 family metallopeptidase [Myxococcales bacterium]|nr:M23 family metallopeptidase [Myxococcales bacterium]MCB9708216.1 M23 family metallopeptidase [Myxococcales bacterium]
MPANQGQDTNLSVHQPLPRVDIPLLAQERRRRTRMVWVGPMLALSVGLGIAAAWLIRPRLFGGSTGESPSARVSSSDPLKVAHSGTPGKDTPSGEGTKGLDALQVGGDAPSSPRSDLTRTTAPFGKAKGFQQAIMLAGVTDSDALALVKSMAKIMDFRHCRPEDQLILERDAQGQLQGFEYQLSPVRIFRAERQPNGNFVSRQKEVKLDTTRIVRGGKVNTSLGDALEAVGLGRTLVGVFVQVFERQMNFATDTRQGDSFKISVDEERLKGEFWRYGVAHALEYHSQKNGVLRAYWFEAVRGEPEYFLENGTAVQGGWLRTPLRYEYISSGFSEDRYHPVVKRVMPHHGVDCVAATGTAVWAAADGRVTFVGQKGPNGNLVIVRHNNGYQSYYAHLSRFTSGLKPGKRVKQHEVLGYVGSTGRSTGPHLHFGLKRGARFVDPLKVLNTPGPPLRGKAAQRFSVHAKTLQRELERH